MVEYYPGPWQDGPLTTEVHDIGAGTVTRSTDAPVVQPVASGWSVAGWRTWTAGASAAESIPGSSANPPVVGPGVSQEAWAEARSVPVADGVGGVASAHIAHPPMQLAHDGFGTWRHSERWVASGGYWKLRYRRPDNNLTAGVAPPAEEWPEGAVGIGFDYPPPGNIDQYWIDLLSVSVHGTHDAYWPLRIKRPNETVPWFGDDNDPEDISDNAALAVSGTEIPDFEAIDVADLDAFVQENVELGEMSQYDLRWLSGSVVPGAPFPGAYGATDFAQAYGPANCGRVVVQYRPPRWRYIYDRPVVVEPLPVESVPYRRNFPRDDSLAGGAGRNFPRPRSVQGSNRIGGGYL